MLHCVGDEADQLHVLGVEQTAGLGHLVHQPLPGRRVLAFGRGQTAEYLRDSVPVCGDDRQFRGRFGEGGHDRRDVVIGEQHRFLDPEVAVERARRDVGGLGDLIDGGLGVAPFGEQFQGGTADGRTGLDLLAFPQTHRYLGCRHPTSVP